MIKLHPYTQNPLSSSLRVSSSVSSRSDENSVFVRFEIRGDIQNILWPSSPASGRHHELWKQTCFELFGSDSLAPDSPYFEVNVSPTGAWNIYDFSSYRQGMTDSLNQSVAEISFDLADDRALIEFRLSLEAALPKFLGLTCVIQSKNGDTQYWALQHSSPKADFHDKRTWSPSSALR